VPTLCPLWGQSTAPSQPFDFYPPKLVEGAFRITQGRAATFSARLTGEEVPQVELAPGYAVPGQFGTADRCGVCEIVVMWQPALALPGLLGTTFREVDLSEGGCINGREVRVPLGVMALGRSSLNRTQGLVLGFFVFAWATLVVILMAAPEVYDQALRDYVPPTHLQVTCVLGTTFSSAGWALIVLGSLPAAR
jgi:hypothetical protein